MQVNHTMTQLMTECETLRADNERLKAALNKIMRNDPEGYEASIARRALEWKDD